MAKALDPDIYRNIELDSWNERRKELKTKAKLKALEVIRFKAINNNNNLPNFCSANRMQDAYVCNFITMISISPKFVFHIFANSSKHHQQQQQQ